VSSRMMKTTGRPFARTAMLSLLVFLFAAAAGAQEDANRFVLQRDNRTIVLEPYGPNIIGVTLTRKDSAVLAPAGYGITGTPSAAGWSHEKDAAGDDVVRSTRLVVKVAPENLPQPHPMPLDDLNCGGKAADDHVALVDDSDRVRGFELRRQRERRPWLSYLGDV
jgi:hypothetical protein